VLHDIKNSNYFRVWLLLWFVTFVLFWVGFGVYVSKVNNFSSLYAIGLNGVSSVPFPPFHFRFQGHTQGPSAFKLDSISCNWNNSVSLNAVDCLGYPPWSTQPQDHVHCFAIYPPANVSARAWTDMGNFSTPPLYWPPSFNTGNIFCNFSVSTTRLNGLPGFVSWGLEDANTYGYGDNGNAPAYFSNNATIWVLLEEFLINNNPYWDKSLIGVPLYGSLQNNTSGGDLLFFTATGISSTTVKSYAPFSLDYHSWASLADAGGLAFALLLMRIVFMAIIGFFLDNDSTFLRGGDDTAH